MRRIGSNIRKQNADQRSNRLIRNIIRYTDQEKPLNDYPKKIISPPKASGCCTDEGSDRDGRIHCQDGFKFCYKICETCGHAVRFFYPAAEGTSSAVKNYRQWKKYMVQ